MPLIFNSSMPVYKKFQRVRPHTLTQDAPRGTLSLLFFNLMKNKVEAEEQFLRCLAETKHTISVEFLRQTTHRSLSDREYLDAFYKSPEDIKERYFDAMIITGAPLDQLRFEDVYYWQEVCSVLEWSKEHVRSVFHSCWGALAGLYYHHQVDTYFVPKKISGIFTVDVLKPQENLFCGLGPQIHVPISRAMDIDVRRVQECDELVPLAGREGKPPVILMSRDARFFYSTAHPEYGRERLGFEYNRDKDKTYSYSVDIPKHYFPEDNPENEPFSYWIGESDRLFHNWIDFYVAQ